MASRRVNPLEAPALVSLAQPLNQGMLEDFSIMLSPCHPEIGTKATVLGLYPATQSTMECEFVHTDFLDEVGGFLDDFLVSGLRPLGGVHLVDGNDELFDTKSISEQSVLTSLTVLGDTSFEFTDTSSNDDLK